eukprot:CAMPEP_0174275094 /NCGR_PEP_ID=MMETSP0439-20130205/59641_1 /TAXON_ID=0 /ORGANISM="Stereomyxa ramosa, Strain Chinc5" /LENGTH=166 /DNA_ID=CAMNT_0015367171 /DNA_START=8 /DNA_END=511 /DNA_ORIENTATION=+
MSRREKRSNVADYGGETDLYIWDQTKTEVSVTMKKVRDGIRGKDIVCNITKDTLQFGIKGEPLLIDGELGGETIVGDCTWCLDPDDGTVEINLQKKDEEVWWASVVKGDPEIDLDLIEGTKYLDDSLLRKIKEQKLEKKRQEEAERLKKEQEGQEGQEGDAEKTEA